MQHRIKKYSNKLSFNSHDDFDTHPVAEVNCPNCGTTTNINFSNLRKHQDSQFSNLSDEHNELLTRITSDSAPELTNSFLDYYCPNCKTGIRILYESWAGGRHGEHGYELRNLLTT
ncbi:hypothetical protein [Ekhidna sp.]|uniref:hypothetical protein n=1 Tax=Ekhidna sp. TaxID=2608089 RepID=UPI003B5A56BC